MKEYSRRSLVGLLGAGLITALGVSAASAEVIIEERVMPAPRVEVIPRPPRVGVYWVPGHWVWRGGWVWVGGHYGRRVVRPMPAMIVETRPPRISPRHVWVRGHWAWSDRRGDWVWVRGHWAR